MQFFKLKDLLKSWSVWGLGLLTSAPVIDHFTGLISAVVPAEYQAVAVSVVSAITLIARAIKQKGVSNG
nr:MAG TPA: hypothetical protein [Caudoviricetes sp.]